MGGFPIGRQDAAQIGAVGGRDGQAVATMAFAEQRAGDALDERRPDSIGAIIDCQASTGHPSSPSFAIGRIAAEHAAHTQKLAYDAS
jgi:hypothetical protein